LSLQSEGSEKKSKGNSLQQVSVSVEDSLTQISDVQSTVVQSAVVASRRNSLISNNQTIDDEDDVLLEPAELSPTRNHHNRHTLTHTPTHVHLKSLSQIKTPVHTPPNSNRQSNSSRTSTVESDTTPSPHHPMTTPSTPTTRSNSLNYHSHQVKLDNQISRNLSELLKQPSGSNPNIPTTMNPNNSSSPL